MTRMLRQIGLIALILFASMGSLFAQDAEPARKSPLGVRQDNVTRMIEEMEEKFVRLAKALEDSEPDQAARLLDALRESKEALIRQKAAENQRPTGCRRSRSRPGRPGEGD
jgi:hypothetical protein